MDVRKDVSEFLTSRRAKLNPLDVGLPNYGSRRRVPGLRREEVAMLAGVSVDYYTRIERGNLDGVSDSVLEAVMRVLNLDAAEREYLANLAGITAKRKSVRTPAKPATLRPGLLRLLEAINEVPAYVRNETLDILATNALADKFFEPMRDADGRPMNIARFMFLNPKAREFFVEWDRIAEDTVGVLRTVASRNPFDKSLTDLIGELCTQSEFFSVRWANHNVFIHSMGSKKFNHPEVGQMTLFFEALDLITDPGLSLITYVAEKGSASDDALKLLAISANEKLRAN
ncbi:MAG: hypothetical protein RLZZ229_892 [Actinomycetota bacterium]|jgi:transcriptional regulator with XRE-family HTH domain